MAETISDRKAFEAAREAAYRKQFGDVESVWDRNRVAYTDPRNDLSTNINGMYNYGRVDNSGENVNFMPLTYEEKQAIANFNKDFEKSYYGQQSSDDMEQPETVQGIFDDKRTQAVATRPNLISDFNSALDNLTAQAKSGAQVNTSLFSNADDEILSNYAALFGKTGSQVDAEGLQFWRDSGLTGTELTKAMHDAGKAIPGATVYTPDWLKVQATSTPSTVNPVTSVPVSSNTVTTPAPVTTPQSNYNLGDATSLFSGVIDAGQRFTDMASSNNQSRLFNGVKAFAPSQFMNVNNAPGTQAGVAQDLSASGTKGYGGQMYKGLFGNPSSSSTGLDGSSMVSSLFGGFV